MVVTSGSAYSQVDARLALPTPSKQTKIANHRTSYNVLLSSTESLSLRCYAMVYCTTIKGRFTPHTLRCTAKSSRSIAAIHYAPVLTARLVTPPSSTVGEWRGDARSIGEWCTISTSACISGSTGSDGTIIGGTCTGATGTRIGMPSAGEACSLLAYDKPPPQRVENLGWWSMSGRVRRGVTPTELGLMRGDRCGRC